MDFEKIKTDFEKRYDRECENIYFVGEGVRLFSENAKSLSGCLSIGEAMALSKRDDGRITLQVSGTTSMISFNVDEMKKYKDLKFLKVLEATQSCGITLGGADIFIFKNSRITDLLEPLVIGGLSAFCENVQRDKTLLPRFQNYAENMMVLSGKSKSVTLFDGQRTSYLNFFSGLCKLVITYKDSGFLNKNDSVKSSFEDAVLALKKRDIEKFGALLDKDTQKLLKKNKCYKQEEMFLCVKATKDAFGSGIMSCGGVFSLVENSKVDRFIHNVSSIHQKHFGGVPEFYVTDFVDSGFFAKKD